MIMSVCLKKGLGEFSWCSCHLQQTESAFYSHPARTYHAKRIGLEEKHLFSMATSLFIQEINMMRANME